MKDLAPPLVMAVAAALVLACGGCGDSGAGSADVATELYQTGLRGLYDALSDVPLDAPPWEWEADVAEPLELFESALEHDPDHCGALLASAVTRVLWVATDPELRSILNELFPEDGRASRGALFWYADGPDPAGLVNCLAPRRGDFHSSELQEYLEGEVLPVLDVADARLNRFEELGCSVELVIVVPAIWPEQPQIVRVEIDVTDAFFVHSALDALQAAVHVVSAYNVDVDDGQTRQSLVQEDVDFVVLRTGDHMPATYAELAELAGHVLEAAHALDAEADPQHDDIVTESEGLLALEEIFGPGALGQIEELGEALSGALTCGLTLNPSDLVADDPGAPNIDIVVNLVELFCDPLEDLREYFPMHTWLTPDSMEIARPISMPDATFDGITAGMSDAAWEDVASWLEGNSFR